MLDPDADTPDMPELDDEVRRWAAAPCTWCYHPRDIHDLNVHVSGGVWCAACANQTCRPPE